jgi:ribose-phosphate pyrophosphokinase
MPVSSLLFAPTSVQAPVKPRPESPVPATPSAPAAAPTGDTVSIRFAGANARKTAEAKMKVEQGLLDPDTVKIFSGRANPALAMEVADLLGLPLSPIKLGNFKNSEIRVEIQENVRNCDVFVIQPTGEPVNDNLMELMLMIDALKRAKAKSITVLMPHYGYARQDSQHTGREPISAKVVAKMISHSGADHVVLMDPHFNQAEGFFDITADVLTAAPVLIGYLKSKQAAQELKDPVLVAADAGGVKRFEIPRMILDWPKAILEKGERPGPNQLREEASELISGTVAGREAVVWEDLLDTAGTAVKTHAALVENTARKVYLLATHGVFSGEAPERIARTPFDEVVVTNALPLPKTVAHLDQVTQISIAPILATAINRIHTGESLGEMTLKGMKQLLQSGANPLPSLEG